MKAVIYARYSSGPDQREESIEGQIRECREFAKANDITVIKTYVDRAMSGRTDDRAAFQKMLHDTAKRAFQAIIVWKIDRFGRNREEIAINKVRCRQNGVQVMYAKEHIPDGPEGIILESVLEGMAEYYSVELAQKVKRGMKENALKCMSAGGTTPLGYRIGPDKRYEIDPITAPAVKWIFEQYDAGKTLRSIASELNSRGIKSARGGRFNKNSFHTMLRNRRYIGIYIHDEVEIEGGMPAIVDRDLFERVQKRMDANRRAPGRAKAIIDYLLSGKVFCGHCESSMIGESGTSHTGKVYSYYKCSKRKNSGACKKTSVGKDWLEDLVIEETVKQVLVDKVIDFISEKVEEIQKAEHENSDLKYYESKLKDIEKAIRNLLTAIEQGIITQSTKARLQELESQKVEFQSRIGQEKISRVFVTKEQVKFWMEQFKKGDKNDPEYRQRLVDAFIYSVFVYDEDDGEDKGGMRIHITYNYAGGSATVKGSDLEGVCPPTEDYPNLFFTDKIFGLIIRIAGNRCHTPLKPADSCVRRKEGNSFR